MDPNQTNTPDPTIPPAQEPVAPVNTPAPGSEPLIEPTAPVVPPVVGEPEPEIPAEPAKEEGEDQGGTVPPAAV